MTRVNWLTATAGLFSMMIGCLLLGIGVVVLTPDEWLLIAGLLPLEQSVEPDVAPPVAITISSVAGLPPYSGGDAETPDEEPAAEPTLAAMPTAAATIRPGSTTPIPTIRAGATIAPSPTLVRSPTATATATATPTPAPTVSQAQVNFVGDLLKPLVEETARRRAARETENPQTYAKRIDKQLNQNRINFLVFGYGTTYELPFPPTYKGSIAVYSLDMRTLQISQITMNHDIRAPEIERYVQSIGRQSSPTKIDLGYAIGGFDLMRLAVEDATGLSVDFQLAFQDGVVRSIIDEVFGGLIVDVPYIFEASPVIDNNELKPALRYAKGKQKLNGLQTLQFIKAIDAQLGKVKYDPKKELTVRKQIIVQSVLESIKKETTNPIFWGKLLAFLHRTLDKKDIEYDFDATTLLFKTIGQYVATGARGQKIPISLTRNVYVVDFKVGDGGVQWVTGSLNPIMVRDLKNGVYPDIAISVPLGKADPYASDLPTNYWTSVRQLIKQRLAP